MDMRTGEPVINPVGNVQECNVARAFNQYIDVMLHTPLLGEVSLPSWGVPLKQIFDMRFNLNWEKTLKYYIGQALNGRWEPLIDEVLSIEAERNGNAIDLSLHLTSRYGTNSKLEIKLYE